MKRAGSPKTTPAAVTAWVERSRARAGERPGRRYGSTLAAVGDRKRREFVLAQEARAVVFARDRHRCQFPHGLMPGVACGGGLELCHVIPIDLAPRALRWHPDNLFVGCHNGNGWSETNTGEAFATGRHGHSWDRVRDGRVVAA